MTNYTLSGYQPIVRPPLGGGHSTTTFNQLYDAAMVWENGATLVTGGWRPIMPGDFTATAPSATDAFSRLRTSNPVTVFDSTFQYSLASLLYEQITFGTATITHDPVNACAKLACTVGGVGDAALQSYRYIRYQPGKSTLVLLTFAFGTATANTTKRVGLWDQSNGFYLEQIGLNTINLVRLSTTSVGNLTVPQVAWNLDPMNGNGPSHLTLDLTKTQILVMDAQWLGVGRVRMGFNIGGTVYYVHEFLNANIQNDAYTQTFNLPVRAQLVTSSAVAANMKMLCASVQSEGGIETEIGYGFTAEAAGQAGNGSMVHIMSIQPTTGFNGLTNRTFFSLEGLDLVNIDNGPLYWALGIGTTVGGPFVPANATYSAIEVNYRGTLTGSPAIIFANGYLPATNQSKSNVTLSISTKYPITLDASGVARTMGRISLLASGMGASANMRAAFTWKEIR